MYGILKFLMSKLTIDLISMGSFGISLISRLILLDVSVICEEESFDVVNDDVVNDDVVTDEVVTDEVVTDEVDGVSI